MPAIVYEGTIVLRDWNKQMGLRESEQPFSTLDELFALCLGVSDPMLVDRVVLRGTGEDGEMRTLVFTFQSITGAEERA